MRKQKKRNDLLILQSISGLNEFSHEIIDSQINFPNITACFLSDKIKNYFLPDHADSYFTLENDFGGLYLHYAQIGKSWLDFLIDNDNVITKEEIEPLKNINGDFDLCFLNSLKKGNENYKNFFSFLEERLHAYNENIENKKLRLGRILLAYPLFNENEEIFNKIKDFNKIKTMTFIGKNKIITKVFSYCQEMV